MSHSPLVFLSHRSLKGQFSSSVQHVSCEEDLTLYMILVIIVLTPLFLSPTRKTPPSLFFPAKASLFIRARSWRAIVGRTESENCACFPKTKAPLAASGGGGSSVSAANSFSLPRSSCVRKHKCTTLPDCASPTESYRISLPSSPLSLKCIASAVCLLVCPHLLLKRGGENTAMISGPGKACTIFLVALVGEGERVITAQAVLQQLISSLSSKLPAKNALCTIAFVQNFLQRENIAREILSVGFTRHLSFAGQVT